MVDAQVLGIRSVFLQNQLAFSPRIAAAGGDYITVRDDDVSLAFSNPAMLNGEMHNRLAFNQSFHLAGMKYGSVAYARKIDQRFNWSAGIQYFSYGDFTRTDVIGNNLGSFKGSDIGLIGGVSTTENKVSYGANLKLLQSNIESYNATAIAGDIAAAFVDTAKMFSATIVLKDVGGFLNRYGTDTETSLPTDLQIGVSKRLEHLPFRLSVLVHHLNIGDIRYADPSDEVIDLFDSDTSTTEPNWFGRTFSGDNIDNFFRHFTFTGEFYFGQNFNLLFAYDHMQRSELSVPNAGGLTGFSFGMGMKIYRFRIQYGFANYHRARTTHHLGITTKLSDFIPKTEGAVN